MILKVEYFFVNYHHLLLIIVNYCPGERKRFSDLFRNDLKGWIFFVNYHHLLLIIVNYCPGERKRISYLFRNDLRGWIFFRQLSSLIVNYRLLLSEWETTNQVISSEMHLKGEYFSSIFVIYGKLSSIIVRVRDNESLISSEMMFKGEYFFVNYCHLL